MQELQLGVVPHAHWRDLLVVQCLLEDITIRRVADIADCTDLYIATTARHRSGLEDFFRDLTTWRWTL